MNDAPIVSPLAAGIASKCPRCGDGALFEGFLSLRPACASCGLDFAKADSGDGPAVFVIFLVGFATVALAFAARFVWHAPMWLAFALSAGAVAALIAALLRPLKATLIALQFHNKAAEPRSRAP